MARTNTRFVETYNQMLSLCDEGNVGAILPSENTLATQHGVSRTVIRSVLTRFSEEGLITLNGRDKVVKRHSSPKDALEKPATLLTIEELEEQFLEWVLRMDVPPGTPLNVAQLAKEFTVAPHTLQEFFAALSRFGIVVRRPKGGWILHGFTTDYALELSDFRAVLELNAVAHIVQLDSSDPIWAKLDQLEQAHLDLLSVIDTAYHDFSKLDENFHEAINGVVANRFVKEFQKVISLVFHYHFQWNKKDERTRNECAIREHLVYIDALRSRDIAKAEAAARSHLATSKQTLLNSLKANSKAV